MEKKDIQFESIFERIYSKGGPGNYAIIKIDEGKNYYLQIAAQRGESVVQIEAASNAYIEQEYSLSPDQMEKMEILGWNPPSPTRSPNYWGEGNIGSPECRKSLADLFSRTIKEVYCNEVELINVQVEINLE